jgi:hypothetical protein
MKKMLRLDGLGICARLSVVLSHQSSDLLSRRGDEAQSLLDLLDKVRYLFLLVFLYFTNLTVEGSF